MSNSTLRAEWEAIQSQCSHTLLESLIKHYEGLVRAEIATQKDIQALIQLAIHQANLNATDNDFVCQVTGVGLRLQMRWRLGCNMTEIATGVSKQLPLIQQCSVQAKVEKFHLLLQQPMFRAFRDFVVLSD